MPREVAHAFIATNALSYTKNLKFSILENEPLKSAFLLGTITPDSGYYLKSPFFNGDLLSDYVHGINENNSFKNLQFLIENSNLKHKAINEAFSLGIISHILLDSFWHPLIFKLTGDYYHSSPIERTNARARHRRFEILIDCLIIKNYSLCQKNYLIKNYLKNELTEDLDKDYLDVLKLKKRSLSTAWKWHENFQNLFSTQKLSIVSKKLKIPREFRALFSNFETQNLELIEELVLKHLNINFPAWIEESTLKLSKIFLEYEIDSKSFFTSNIGPSANSGIVAMPFYNGHYEIEEMFLNGY